MGGFFSDWLITWNACHNGTDFPRKKPGNWSLSQREEAVGMCSHFFWSLGTHYELKTTSPRTSIPTVATFEGPHPNFHKISMISSREPCTPLIQSEYAASSKGKERQGNTHG